MNRRGRILVIDDDEFWRDETTEILQHAGYQADSAPTLLEAQELLNDTDYHVLVVDLRMNDADPGNEDGLNLLKELNEQGSSEATKTIMLTAYGTKEQTRTAFREYDAADFLYKQEFNQEKFLESVRRVFAEEVKINLALDIRWQEGRGPEQAVDNVEIEGKLVVRGTSLHSHITTELEDLLCRLFFAAKSIFVRPLSSGKSGTGILWVQPFYATGGGGYVVAVKFGDSRMIEQEYDNFKQLVQPFLGDRHNTTIQGFRRTPRLGGIIYSLLDTVHDQLVDFGEFYWRSDVPKIQAVLDQLFQDICGTWYSNRGDLQLLDLTKDYRRLLSYNSDTLEHVRYSELTTVRGQHKLFFTSLSGINRKLAFTNPILAISEKGFVRPTYVSITHGDLHHHNLFIDAAGRLLLIDFQATAQSHILRDVALLDSVVRFQLLAPEEATLEERLQMEKVLSSIERFSQLEMLKASFTTENKVLAKAYATVMYLRLQARKLVELNPDDDMSEYYIALMYIALNTIRFSSLALTQREHALLSASLLADRLQLNKAPEDKIDLSSRATDST